MITFSRLSMRLRGLAAAVAAGLLSFAAPSCSCSGDGNGDDVTVAGQRRAEELAQRRAMFEQIQSVHRMVFATMTVTKTVRTDRTAWYKVGHRVAVYSYDTYLEASVDLSALTPDDIVYDEASHNITVTLPEVQTRLSGRDAELRLDYENIGLMRSSISPEERARLKEMANADLRREVAENPTFRENLTGTAEQKARAWLTALLARDGWTVTVDFEKPVFKEDR